MFSKNDRSLDKPQFSNNQNKIARNTVFTGEIESEGNFRIEGQLKGVIKTPGKVVVGETGFVDGEIICGNAHIVGKITGTVTASNALNLKSSAVIEGGTLNARKLSVNQGARLNGTCRMKEDVKKIGDGKAERQEAEKQPAEKQQAEKTA